MRNVYKQLNIFKCVHEAHQGFESRMSVHHILNQKGCYPQGCFYFKGHCKLFKQGKNCYRGYQHIGRNCTGCRYFYEEKVFNRAELQISEAEYRDFQHRLNLFEDWLLENVNREREIHGKIDGVKPLFHKRIYHKGAGFSFSGFLLIFKELYFERELMEDHVYARLSPKTYASLKLGRGDVLTARATLTLDRGRLVLKKLRRFEIEERGEAPVWNESRALVARETATHIPTQPEGCVQCPFGALIDVEDFCERETRFYRQLYCLQGMPDYRVCPEYHRHAGTEEEKQKLPTNSASCMARKVNVALKL
jgi:hypothetical protein